MPELVATVCAGLFAGAAIYISVVQHPAAQRAGPRVAATFFPPMYRRAAPMQAGLAVVGTLAGTLAWLLGSGVPWLVGASLLGSVVPFTLLRMRSVNERLLAAGPDAEAQAVADLLARWGRLHLARSAAGALAFLAFLAGWAFR